MGGLIWIARKRIGCAPLAAMLLVALFPSHVGAGARTERIVYGASIERDGTSYEAVVRSRADGNRRKILFARKDIPTHGVSPDRRKIAIAHAVDGTAGSRLVIVASDGSWRRTLVRIDRGAIRSISWSPDSRKIAFAFDRRGERHFKIKKVDGSTRARTLVKGDVPNNLFLWAWARRGTIYLQQIEFRSEPEFSIRFPKVFHVRASGGRVKRLDKATRAFPSPTGNRILTLETGDRYDRLLVYRADASGRRLVRRFPAEEDREIQWAADSRTFVLLRTKLDRTSVLEIYSHRGGAKDRFGASLSKRKSQTFDSMTVSPDGKIVIFSAVSNNIYEGTYLRDRSTGMTCKLPDWEGGVRFLFSHDGSFAIAFGNELLGTLSMNPGETVRYHQYGEGTSVPQFLGNGPIVERHPCRQQ